jgi:predicted P-loop ATPase
MSILPTLLQLQIDPLDAHTLEQHYGSANAAGFMDAIEKTARAIADDMPQDLLPPAIEPWQSILTFMLLDGAADIRERFQRALLVYPSGLREALARAVQVRVDAHLAWINDAQKTAHARKNSAYYIRTLGKLGYKFRMNLCDDHIEINARPLSDGQAAEIRTRCRDLGLTRVNEIEDAYIAEAWRSGYHPVKEYLLDRRYDGGRHIEDLAGCFTDEYGMFETWLKKWLVGAVAKVLGQQQNRMLVLDGGQGLGKSSFVRWLAGGVPNYHHEGQIDTYNRKDTEVQLMNTWIWEVSELGGTVARAEMNALKAIISQQWVKVRKAYGRNETIKPAMASFIGTINNEAGFLNDYTGSRRYMVARLTAIDWGYTRLRADDVWAQAVWLYQDGFKWSLDEAERETADEINEVYTVEDVTQAAILKYFELDANEPGWFLSTLDIAQTLETKGVRYASSNATMMAVGRALAALGLTRTRKGPRGAKREQGYAGIRFKPFGIP